MTEKATDRHAHDAEFPQPEKPCCCPPRVAVWGSTSQTLVPLANQMHEDEQLQVRADANASVNPPGGPQVNADGSGGSEIRTRLRKDVDLVGVTVTYRFEWHATGLCHPLSVRVKVAGAVQAQIQCAPERGHTELTMRRLLKAAELNGGPTGSATAVVTVADCTGQSARCDLTLHEA